MKYKVTLYMSQYMKVGDDYKTVNSTRTFTYNDYDDAQNLIGYLVHGANGPVKFEIEEIEEEA